MYVSRVCLLPVSGRQVPSGQRTCFGPCSSVASGVSHWLVVAWSYSPTASQNDLEWKKPEFGGHLPHKLLSLLLACCVAVGNIFNLSSWGRGGRAFFF